MLFPSPFYSGFLLALILIFYLLLRRHNNKLQGVIEDLQISEERYRRMFENSIYGIFQSTADGRFVRVNQAFADIMKYDSPEDVIHSITDIASQYYADPAERQRVQSIISDEGQVDGYEVRVRCKDGSVKWITSITRAYFDETGALKRHEGMIRDITERKRNEKAQRESEQRYRSLFEAAYDAIFILREESFLDCNPNALKMFACDREDILGCTPYALSPTCQPDGRPSQEKAEVYMSRAYRGDSQFFQWRYRRKDGSEFDAEVSLTRFVLNDAPHLMAISRDISERIESEKRIKSMEKRLFQSQKMEAIGTLAGGIAHDFNNILAAVIGYTELLQMKLPPGSAELNYARQIDQASKRAKDLVLQILTFSRQSEPERKPVVVNAIIREVTKLLRSSLPTTIEIRQHIPSKALIMGDATQLHQILINLCSNAGHAMQQDGGVMTIELEDTKIDSLHDSGQGKLKPGDYVRLRVSDTGRGIQAQHIDRVFDPFFTTKKPGEGTGMGLSVVHGIVESYGGTIQVYSRMGEGTTLEVFLPAVEPQAEPVASSMAEKVPGGSEHILLVDDEPALVEMGKHHLEMLGYRVSPRTNSLEALELFKNKSQVFDLLITDMTMPHLTGDELVQEIKRIRADIPVILCTGFSTKITPDNIQDYGVDAFVMKPLIVRELALCIRRVLDGQ